MGTTITFRMDKTTIGISRSNYLNVPRKSDLITWDGGKTIFEVVEVLWSYENNNPDNDIVVFLKYHN